MFDTVLLPIDLNHPASWQKALPIATKMCGTGGTLHILGIVHDLGSAAIAAYLPQGFEQEALKQMKADLDAFAGKEVSGVAVETHVGHGHVPECILHTGRDINADVIVMASHPPDELMSFLVGSSAAAVVRHSERPVFVVR